MRAANRFRNPPATSGGVSETKVPTPKGNRNCSRAAQSKEFKDGYVHNAGVVVVGCEHERHLLSGLVPSKQDVACGT
jgi:hypothetical protein